MLINNIFGKFDVLSLKIRMHTNTWKTERIIDVKNIFYVFSKNFKKHVLYF